MGKVLSRLNKQFYRFNAENRAHREISKEKPRLAPKHPSTEKLMLPILEDSKHLMEQAMTKDPALDEYLKKVYVRSHDPAPEIKKKPSERLRMPMERKKPEEVALGYHEPEIIPKGKVTLFQVMKFLADHQGDPQLFNVSKISKDYELSEEDAGLILEYFSSFKVHIKEDQLKVESKKDKLLNYFGLSDKPVLIGDKPIDGKTKSESLQ